MEIEIAGLEEMMNLGENFMASFVCFFANKGTETVIEQCDPFIQRCISETVNSELRLSEEEQV